MAEANGYGMKAKDARSPAMGKNMDESSPDSGKPGSQYNQGKSPASPSDGNSSAADSGKPSSNHTGF